jgi:hypothetical protein
MNMNMVLPAAGRQFLHEGKDSKLKLEECCLFIICALRDQLPCYTMAGFKFQYVFCIISLPCFSIATVAHPDNCYVLRHQPDDGFCRHRMVVL